MPGRYEAGWYHGETNSGRTGHAEDRHIQSSAVSRTGVERKITELTMVFQSIYTEMADEGK